jgi:hypothetical protein
MGGEKCLWDAGFHFRLLRFAISREQCPTTMEIPMTCGFEPRHIDIELW